MAYIATQRLVTGHRRIAMKIHPTDGLAEANMPRIWAEPCNPVGTNLWLRPVLSYYDKSGHMGSRCLCISSVLSFLPSFLGWLAGWLFSFSLLDLLHTFPKILHPSTIPIHNPNPLAASRLLFGRGDVEGFFPRQRWGMAWISDWKVLSMAFEHGVFGGRIVAASKPGFSWGQVTAQPKTIRSNSKTL